MELFKRPRAKQFNIQTRYYDPEKEEKEKRKKKYSGEKKEYNRDDLREEMQYRWGLNRKSNLSFNKKNTSNKRTLTVIAVLIILLAIMFGLQHFS